MINNVVDTIVAIATPPGRGGVGIVRLSGPHAWAIVQGIFPVSPGLACRSRFLNAE